MNLKDLAERAGRLPEVPAPKMTLNWYRPTDDEVKAILSAFPDFDWKPATSGGTQWLTARSGDVELNVFDNQKRDAEPPPHRLEAFLDAL